MAIEEVLRKVLADEHAEVIRDSVRWVVQELVGSEVSEGAKLGERRPDDRATHRNGYRARRWDTRAGEIELQIPKARQGSYFPSFLQPRKRSEQALWPSSSRRTSVAARRAGSTSSSRASASASRGARSAGSVLASTSKSRRSGRGRWRAVIRICSSTPKVEKVRDGGRVQRKCVVMAHGVHETGRKEIIGLDVGHAETETFWTEFLRGLVARGLLGDQLVISDAHAGLKAAIGRVLGDAAWQRCTVHFSRTALAKPAKTSTGCSAR